MSQPDIPQKHHRVRNTIIAPLVVAAIVIAALVAAAVWLVQEQQGDGAATLEATAVDAETLPQTVPFRFVAGHIVVDAVLGDESAPTALILDTGAPTILSDEVADAVGGEAAGTMGTMAIDGTIEQSDVVPVSTLRLGDAEFSDVGAIKGFLEADNPLTCISPNGLIGASLMKEGVWQIDYDAEEITIAADTSGLDHVEGALSLPFTWKASSSPSPLIVLPAGEGSLDFLVDTGSDGWLAVDPADLEGTGVELDAGNPAFGVISAGAAGTFEGRVQYVAADLAVGDQQLQALPIATIETLAAGQGNIGNDFLSRYVVTFDWPGATLYLDPVTDDPQPSIPASATVSWDGQDMIVGSIVEGTPGYDGVVELGARVETIDGVDVSSATLDDYCSFTTGRQLDTFEMTVLTDTAASVQVSPVDDFYDALAAP